MKFEATPGDFDVQVCEEKRPLFSTTLHREVSPDRDDTAPGRNVHAFIPSMHVQNGILDIRGHFKGCLTWVYEAYVPMLAKILVTLSCCK
jgi:hypothetical protein